MRTIEIKEEGEEWGEGEDKEEQKFTNDLGWLYSTSLSD
jgi:hypothetical protein